jgi:hypothetical protein
VDVRAGLGVSTPLVILASALFGWFCLSWLFADPDARSDGDPAESSAFLGFSSMLS